MKTICMGMLLLAAISSQAAITVKDGGGATVTLEKPAQRVVTLAPHATELVFAAGAGGRVVGASAGAGCAGCAGGEGAGEGGG